MIETHNPKQKPIAIITGVSRGIGKAIAIKFVELGYKVVGVYKSNEKLAKLLENQHSDIFTIKANVGEEKDVKEVINETIKKFNTIDVVVNNAGIDLFGEIETYDTKV